MAAVILLSESAATATLAMLVGVSLALAFVLEVLLKNAGFVFPLPLTLFTLFVAYCSLQMIWAPGSVARLLTLFLLLVFATIIINYVASSDDIKPVSYGYYFGIIGTFVYSYFHVTRDAEGRLGSTLLNANTYSFALTLGLMFALRELVAGSAAKNLKRVPAILLILYAAMTMYAILYLTSSRKGMIIALAAIAAMTFCWVWQQPVRRRLLYTALIAAGFFGLGYILYRSPEFSRIIQAVNYFRGEYVVERDLVSRFAVMKAGLALWIQRPFTGWGLAQFEVVSGFPYYAHNNYVEVLANHGIIGLMAYLSIYLATGVSLVKTLRRSVIPSLSAEMIWGLTMLAVLLVADLTTVGYLSKLNWIALAVAIGLAVRGRRTLLRQPPYSS